MDEPEQPDEIAKLQRVVSLLSGQGLLDRCSSISVGEHAISVTFGAMGRGNVAEPVQQAKPRTVADRAAEFEANLREHLPGARIPRFAR